MNDCIFSKFRCDVLQTDSYGWLINNTWDGAMDWFVKKKVDLLYHGTSMRTDRLVHVEFTTDICQVELVKFPANKYRFYWINKNFKLFQYTNNISSAITCVDFQYICSTFKS